MQNFIKLVIENKFMSIVVGILFFIAGILSRGQFINSNMVVSLIIPLLLISLGFGFVFTGLFKRENESFYPLFIKSFLAPWVIVITIMTFDKTGINSPILKAGSLFLINIAFFKKEIDKAVNF